MRPQDRSGRAARFQDLPHGGQLECLRELAQAALDRYAIKPGAPLALVNLSENATYRIEDPESGRAFALRVHREGYHSRNAIASELAWLQALRRDGVVTTPLPVAGHDGEIIQQCGHPAMAKPRNVVLFAWESGAEPSASDRLNEKFEVLGEVAARMHRHSGSWPRPPGFERLTWDFETSLGDRPHWGRWRDGIGLGPAKEKVLGQAVELIGRRLDRFGKSPERFGLIHCDMRLANLLLDRDEVKVIDFDDCGFSWRLYDAATAVSFFEHEPHVPDLMQAWVQGYRKVLALPAEDEAEIPTFVMLRRMILVAWIGSHSETELAQSMGVSYTDQTVPMCEDYLSRFG
ncbi:MAG: phosphotransferase [Rhizobiales bacterium]|nr:phosphotransferase [Hyphomicrobiales bacterium]